MGERDRLFRVIVLGGIGMLGAVAPATACSSNSGGSGEGQGDASASSGDGAIFPHEGPVTVSDSSSHIDVQRSDDGGSSGAEDVVSESYFPIVGPPLRLDSSVD